MPIRTFGKNSLREIKSDHNNNNNKKKKKKQQKTINKK